MKPLMARALMKRFTPILTRSRKVGFELTQHRTVEACAPTFLCVSPQSLVELAARSSSECNALLPTAQSAPRSGKPQTASRFAWAVVLQ